MRCCLGDQGEGEQSPGRSQGPRQADRLLAWQDERYCPGPARPHLSPRAAAERPRWVKAGRGPRGHLCVLHAAPHYRTAPSWGAGRGRLLVQRQRLPMTERQPNVLLPASPYGCRSGTASLGSHPAETPPGDPAGTGAAPGSARPCPVSGCHRLSLLRGIAVSLHSKPASPRQVPGVFHGRCSPAQLWRSPGRGPGG